jgi:hypothetical protein
VAGRVRSFEKSIDIRNQACNLPACCIVLQSTMLPPAPSKVIEILEECVVFVKVRFL